jgi:hypothetical protein
VPKERSSSATQVWSAAIEGYARVLLRLSYASNESEIAKEIREIAYALLDLANKGEHDRESEN